MKPLVFASALALAVLIALTVPVDAGLADQAFEIGTPVLAVADAISDLGVAVKYYQNAEREHTRPVFFSIAVVLLSISGMAGSAMFMFWNADKLTSKIESCCECCGDGVVKVITPMILFVIFVLIIPFGQFVPLFIWYQARAEAGDAEPEPQAPPEAPKKPPDGASQNEIITWRVNYDKWEHDHWFPYVREYNLWFKKMVDRKISTHAPFVIETGVEAIPQSLLQCSAIVIYSQRDPEALSALQFASIGMSVMSIMSKAYVGCKSLVKDIFWFKLLCVCFDISCLFYTIGALWRARRDDPDVVEIFFLTRPVDLPSAIYVYLYAGLCFCTVGGLFLLAIFFIVVFPATWLVKDTEVFKEFYDSICECAQDSPVAVRCLAASFALVLYTFMVLFAFVLGTTLMILPMMLVFQSCHASYLILWLQELEARMTDCSHDSNKDAEGNRLQSAIDEGSNEIQANDDNNESFYMAAFEFFKGGSDWASRAQALNHALLKQRQEPRSVSTIRGVCQVVKVLFMKFVSMSNSLKESAEEEVLIDVIFTNILAGWLWVTGFSLLLCFAYGMVYPPLSFYFELQSTVAVGVMPNLFRTSLFLVNLLLGIVTTGVFISRARHFVLFAQAVEIRESLPESSEALIESAQKLYAEHYMDDKTRREGGYERLSVVADAADVTPSLLAATDVAPSPT